MKLPSFIFYIITSSFHVPIVLSFILKELDTKTSRVRTNYKLRVGNKPIGRYTPYSQVRTPPSGKYSSEESERYYRHARVSM